MYGWVGTILEVDLSSAKIQKVSYKRELQKKYIGGRGVNSRILYQEVKPGIDPFGPENSLIFGTGPLGGTIAPASLRMNVSAKAYYNGLGTSNVGGKFGPELKWAGYDHVIIRGKAEKPVYLSIEDDKVEIRPAQHLWGKNTWETDEIIKRELGDLGVKVASIGQAGEKQVKYAIILFTLYRAAGTTGMGAVMGSKNLKAIAVRGSKSVQVAHPEELKRLTRDIFQRIWKNDFYPLMHIHGTPAILPLNNEKGVLLVRNAQQAQWEGLEELSHEKLFRYYLKSKSCLSCPIQCSHFFEIKEGPYAGEKGGGVEYGATMPFGAVLGNNYAPSIFKCLNLSNQYGLDTLELPMTLAAAMEWYEKGIITKRDTDGIPLEWGNHQAIVEMIHKIGKREGFGNLLAEGAFLAAKEIGKGAEEYVTHCKGVSVAGDDIRVLRGMGLSLATGISPAHHEEGMPTPEFFSKDPEQVKARFGTLEVANPLSYNKAKVTAYYQNMCTVVDALEICKFNTDWLNMEIGYKEMAELFSAVTGIDINEEGLYEVGERINCLERAFCVREGFTRKDDHIQGKLMREPVQSGPFKGERLDPDKFEQMLDELYELKGWDKESGIPTRAKLESLDLKEVADELTRLGMLPQGG